MQRGLQRNPRKEVHEARLQNLKSDKKTVVDKANEFLEDTVFAKLLKKAGFVLSAGKTPNEIDVDQAVFQRKLTTSLKAHKDYPEVITKFLDGLQDYIEDLEKFICTLSSTQTSVLCDSARGRCQDSLIKLLLGIDEIQPLLIDILLEKLALCSVDESVTNGNVAVNIGQIIVSQFRWLDHIVENQKFCKKALEILEIASEDTQREIITYLPEIVEDHNQAEVALALSKLIQDKTEFTTVALEALCNLNITGKSLNDVQSQILKTVAAVELNHLPIVVKFILRTVSSENALEVVSELRENLDFTIAPACRPSASVDIQKEERENNVHYLKITLENIKLSMKFHKVVCDAWCKNIENAKEHRIVDVLVLLILLQFNSKKKSIENMFKEKIYKGHFSSSFLRDIFQSHAEILKEYFSSLMELNEVLLHSSNSSVLEFSACLYQNCFNSFDSYYQQEVICALLTHVGSRQFTETESALNIIEELTSHNLKQMASFALLMKGLLDYFENFSLSQIRKVYSILGMLAFNSNFQSSGAMRDEVQIIIRKQLSHNLLKFKRMGVVGALSSVKCMVWKSNRNDTSTQSSSQIKEAIETLELIERSVRRTPEALALFYDELSDIILKKQIHSDVEKWINEMVVNNFQEEFVNDVETESNVKNGDSELELRFGIDEDDCENQIYINLMPLVNTEKKAVGERYITPLTLSSHFRLLRICEYLLNEGSLEGIDALLGCPVYLFHEKNVEKFKFLTIKEKNSTCTALFFCLNWFRELINGFAMQAGDEIFTKCLLRVQNIISIHQMLSELLTQHPTFVPPVAFFDGEVSERTISNAVNPKKKRVQKKQIGAKSKKQKSGTSNSSESSTQSTIICASGAVTLSSTNKLEAQNSTESEKSNDMLMFMNTKFQQYFRELDFDVFTILKGQLQLNSTAIGKDSKRVNLLPSELQFLLEDLVRKLERVFSSTQSCGFHNKPVIRLGFAHIESLGADGLSERMIDILPYLCRHLEFISDYFRSLIEEADGIVDSFNMYGGDADYLSTCFQQILKIFNLYFSWSEFNSIKKLPLLEKALGSLSDQQTASQTSDRRLKKAFQYFTKFSEAVPTFNCAVAIVSLLMTFAEKLKDEEEKEACGNVAAEFLKRQWTNQNGEQEKGMIFCDNLKHLLSMYFNRNLKAKIESLEELTNVAFKELFENKKKNADSASYPTLNKNTFRTYYKVMLQTLNSSAKELSAEKQQTESKLEQWNLLVHIFYVLVNAIKVYDNQSNILLCIKNGRVFVELFLKHGMTMLDLALQSNQDGIQKMLQTFQQSTRYLQHMCSHSKVTQNITLMNQVPALKKTLEAVVYRVKAMLVVNKCSGAFWMGNLKHRNLQGGEIQSQIPAQDAAKSSDDDDDEDQQHSTSDGSKSNDEPIDDPNDESNDDSESDSVK